jgi:hypothetical protein
MAVIHQDVRSVALSSVNGLAGGGEEYNPMVACLLLASRGSGDGSVPVVLMERL